MATSSGSSVRGIAFEVVHLGRSVDSKLLPDLVDEDRSVDLGRQLEFRDPVIQAVEADVEHSLQEDRSVEQRKPVQSLFLPNAHEFVAGHQEVPSELVRFVFVTLGVRFLVTLVVREQVRVKNQMP